MDEGDVVRIMRRTVDLLAQVPYCEAISEQLRTHARQALKAINRFPVAEAEDLLKFLGGRGRGGLNPATERAACSASRVIRLRGRRPWLLDQPVAIKVLAGLRCARAPLPLRLQG